MNEFVYYEASMTVREFLENYGDFNCDPVGQRPDIGLPLENSTGDSKAQEIIKVLLSGRSLGKITVHEPSDDRVLVFKYESIDGGHRKRYIRAFFDNKFRVNGKYYRELSDEEKEYLKTRKLSFDIYQNLDVWEIGKIFRDLNKTTDVNHQEMLNSFGDVLIANAIRGTVRAPKGGKNETHSLFEFVYRENEKKNFVNLQFDNLRLRIEEMVARIYYRYYDGGGLGRADDISLESLYCTKLSESDIAKLKKRVDNCLDFLREIAIVRKQYNTIGLNQKEFSLFSRIWMYMEEEYGSFKVNDIDEFYRTISTAVSEFFKPLEKQDEFLQEISPFDSNKTKGQQFKDTLGEHRSREAIRTTLLWLLERIDMTSLVTLKDPQRLFPRDWREAKLAEQGFKCAVDGQSLTMDNAQGGHIISHTDGGRTTYDNLAMISTEHNRKMGSMSLEQYKELL